MERWPGNLRLGVSVEKVSFCASHEEANTAAEAASTPPDILAEAATDKNVTAVS